MEAAEGHQWGLGANALGGGGEVGGGGQGVKPPEAE